jgi:NSS family neurotransmitter:Na+ symporter
MTDLAAPRAQWRSTSGFILATLGAAIGLGNIWRFSYVVGENGGAAFLLVYAVTMVTIGFPLLVAELAVGRSTQRESASAFALLGTGRLWRRAGLPGVLVSFVILTYYAVIAGWALKYFVAFAAGLYPHQPGQSTGYFRAFVGATFEPVLWQFVVLAVSVSVVIGGIEYGIERVNKILMPVLAGILLLLVAHGLTMPGAAQGLSYLFRPDWSMLAEPRLYLAALGQAFFSLGLAMGVLVTYGSYLPERQHLPAAGAAVVFGDTLFAVAAAMVIFPAVFSFGMSPGEGPGLAFITLPEIFVRMTGGIAIAIAFFGLLVLAALTSLVALIEVPAAFCMARWGWSRRQAALLCGGAGFVLGIPSALSAGVLADIVLLGRPILDSIDHIASNIVLPLSGLAIALFVGWHWRDAKSGNVVGFRSDRTARLWLFVVRYVAPVVIVVIFLRSIGAL